MGADHHARHTVVDALRHAVDPDRPTGEATGQVLHEVERAGQHVIVGDRLQRRQIEVAEQLGQALLSRADDVLAGQEAGGVAGVEEDHAALAKIVLDAVDGCGVQGGMLGWHRPVEEREDGELVDGRIDRHGVAGLDRGPLFQHAAEAEEPGAAALVEVGDASLDIAEPGDGGELGDACLVDRFLGIRQPGEQADGQECGGTRRRPQPRQEAAQREGEGEVDEGEDGRERQERRQEIALGALGIGQGTLAEGGDVEALQPVEGVLQVAGDAAALVLGHIPRGGAGIDGRIEAGGASGAYRQVGQRCRLDRLEVGRRLHQAAVGGEHPVGADEAVESLAGADAEIDDAAQHLHEETGERQAGPARVGGGVDEQDVAVARLAAGDDRRAVGEARQCRLGEVRARLGQHLAIDQRLLADVEPGEEAVGGEGSQRQGLRPGQRTAELAVAGAQPDGQERIVLDLADRLARLVQPGEPGAGETQHHAARLDPCLERCRLGRIEMAAIGDDEQRERLLDQLGDPPGAQLGERGERALDEIGFGEKRLRGRRPGRAGDADRAPPPALVEEQHAADAVIAFEGEAGDAVAHIQRQVELDGGTQGIGVVAAGCRDGEAAEHLAGGADGEKLRRQGSVGGRAQHTHRLEVAGQVVRAEQEGTLGRGVGVDRELADGTERRRQRPGRLGLAIAVDESVAQPDGPGFAEGRCFEARQRRRMVDGPGMGLPAGEPLQHLARRLRLERGGPAVRGGLQHNDRAAVALRLLQQAAGETDPPLPVRGRGPAIVDHQQHGTPAADHRCRVEHRPGEGEEDEGGDGEAQQQEPPRCPRRGLLRCHEPEQQGEWREGDPAGCGWAEAQQQPDQRQGEEPGQDPWLEEGDGAQR